MKQYTTRVLKSLAAVLLAFPMVYLIWVAMIFDIPVHAFTRILISPFFYFVSIGGMVTGYGLWEMRRWSWYVFLFFQFLVCYENILFVLNYSESHHKIFALCLSCILQLALIYRVAKEIRVPYFFPKIRWWESNPRYKLAAHVKLIRENGGDAEGEILDLSKQGCFIKMRNSMTQDERVTLDFAMFGFPLRLQGKIVWLAQPAVTHPKGIGIKFVLLTRASKRSLRAIQRRLKKIAKLYRRSRYLMSQDEFIKKLSELEQVKKSRR